MLVTVPGAALCAARLPATACTPPLTGRLSRRSHSHRPRRPVAPVLLLPCRNLGSQAHPGPQAGESQRHGSSAAGSQGPITPSEQPASSTSQMRLIPLAAPPAVTHPLIFSAKYQNQQWFTPVRPRTRACRLAGAQPSATATASSAWAKRTAGIGNERPVPAVRKRCL